MPWVEVSLQRPNGRAMARGAIGTEPVVVLRLGGRVVVVEALCPHKGGDLAEGRLEPPPGGATGEAETRLRCPVHAASFSLADGSSDQAWAPPLRTWPGRDVDGRIEAWME